MVPLQSLLLVILGVSFTTAQLYIASWNIQIFGVSKMDDPAVVAILVEVINKYDIVHIEEVRDASETAIYELLTQCNAANNDPFSLVMSARLGRTSSTEQYVYFYKSSKVTLVDTYQWDANRVEDKFERPPFVVRFRPTNTNIREFGIIGCHIDPDVAVAENDALTDVYDGMVALWGLQNFIIGGDLNFACSYVSDTDHANIRLRSQSRFKWLIGDEVNTRTRTDYVCAYDRLIIIGPSIEADYLVNTAVAYRFDSELNLSEAQALDVSDHVPVEMKLA